MEKHELIFRGTNLAICPKCGNGNAMLDSSRYDDYLERRVEVFTCRDCNFEVSDFEVIKIYTELDKPGMGNESTYSEVSRWEFARNDSAAKWVEITMESVIEKAREGFVEVAKELLAERKPVKTTFKIERNDFDEFVVVVREGGKRNEARCYYTDDKADAVETMAAMKAEDSAKARPQETAVIEKAINRTKPKHFIIERKGGSGEWSQGTYYILDLIELDPFYEVMDEDDERPRITGPNTGLYLFGMNSTCETVAEVMKELHRTLYDEYQTTATIKEGDTFTVKPHYRYFSKYDKEGKPNGRVKRRIPEMKLRCESFHVLWDNALN